MWSKIDQALENTWAKVNPIVACALVPTFFFGLDILQILNLKGLHKIQEHCCELINKNCSKAVYHEFFKHRNITVAELCNELPSDLQWTQIAIGTITVLGIATCAVGVGCCLKKRRGASYRQLD